MNQQILDRLQWIKLLQKEIDGLINICTHSKVVKISKSDTGGYITPNSIYWNECECLDCGKTWRATMKDKWIRVEDALPEMNRIDENWELSPTVLVTDGLNVFSSGYQVFYGEAGWRHIGRRKVTHWMEIELP